MLWRAIQKLADVFVPPLEELTYDGVRFQREQYVLLTFLTFCSVMFYSIFHLIRDDLLVGGIGTGISACMTLLSLPALKKFKSVPIYTNVGVTFAHLPTLWYMIGYGDFWSSPHLPVAIMVPGAAYLVGGMTSLKFALRTTLIGFAATFYVQYSGVELSPAFFPRTSQPFDGLDYVAIGTAVTIPFHLMIWLTHFVLMKVRDQAEELNRANDRLHDLVISDHLTGVYNRRHLNTMLEKAYAMYKRYKEPFSLLMMDADYFKKVNDEYGHLVGDAALKAMCEECSIYLRDSDSIGRFGGEEFVIVLPKTTAKEAEIVAERIRQGVEKLEIGLEGGGHMKFTISVGVAEVSEEDETWEDILKRADEAVYQAKEGGRNQVVAV